MEDLLKSWGLFVPDIIQSMKGNHFSEGIEVIGINWDDSFTQFSSTFCTPMLGLVVILTLAYRAYTVV